MAMGYQYMCVTTAKQAYTYVHMYVCTHQLEHDLIDKVIVGYVEFSKGPNIQYVQLGLQYMYVLVINSH